MSKPETTILVVCFSHLLMSLSSSKHRSPIAQPSSTVNRMVSYISRFDNQVHSLSFMHTHTRLQIQFIRCHTLQACITKSRDVSFVHTVCQLDTGLWKYQQKNVSVDGLIRDRDWQARTKLNSITDWKKTKQKRITHVFDTHRRVKSKGYLSDFWIRSK